MKKKLILIITAAILILSFTIFFLISSNSNKYDIVVLDELSTPYIDKIEKNYNVKKTSNSTIYTYLDEAKAIELDEYSAKSIIAAGLGKKFISYYNAKTVLVKNKDKTNVDIKSINELKNSDVSVNIANIPSLATRMVNLSISYLLGNEFNLDNAINYYKKIYEENRLDHNYHEIIQTDYLLTTDFEARRHLNENIEIFDIEEGTLTTNIGLLILDDSLDLTKYEEALRDANLQFNEYPNSFKCNDYNIAGVFSKDRVSKFRRNVLGTYKFSGVNSDERSIILIIFLIISVPWAIYIGFRINDQRIRKAVTACLIMVISWLVFRYLKNHISNDILLRYNWYLNYLPLIFAPALFLNANMVIFLPKTNKVKNFTIAMFVTSGIMLFLVLFNDLFQFAFIFKKGLANWQTYSYGWLFYVICLIGFLEIITGIILLVKKNYKQTSKKVLIANVFMFFFIVLYIALDFVGVRFITELDYTLVICVYALSLWELALRAGLVQNCGRYYSLFNQTSFDLALVSKDNKTKITTVNFENDYNDNTRFSEYEISNGSVIFKDNLEILDVIKKELENRKILLEKNNQTLKSEEMILSEYYSVINQNLILDEIDKDYKQKNEEIIGLINKIEPLNDKKEIYPYLARIKFLVSYTKQKYNCYINSKMAEKMEVQTVALAINLIITDSKSLNIDCGLLCNSMELIDSSLGVIILDIFYMMIENALNNQSDLFVNIDVNEDRISMFGLFKENSIIDTKYFTNNVSNMVSNHQIDYEIKQNDDMLKLIFTLRSDK